MTGEKNRFKSHEKLWDLDDKQLKTPKHDAMILWLMNKENLLSILPHEEEIKISTKRSGDFEFKFEGCIIKTEVPIYSNTNFIGGYADLVVKLYYKNKDPEARERAKCIRIPQVIEVKPYIDSFGSVLRQIQTYKSMQDATPYKSHMPLNESLRSNIVDFNRFRRFYIFSFDKRFDAYFENEFIEVLHPPIDFEEMLKDIGGII